MIDTEHRSCYIWFTGQVRPYSHRRELAMNAMNAMNAMRLPLSVATLTAIVSTGLAGCQTATSFSGLSSNLTPNLASTVERPIDMDRNRAVTVNLDWRSAVDDVGRVLYTDHPSRLSPFPIIATRNAPH